MTREWSAVYAAMLTKPRYRRLSPMGRGGLLHVILLAGFQSPEATWTEPDELRDALRLDGFADGVADELIGLDWLVVEDDGALVIRDWDKHQLAASAAIGRAWEARSKREWRRKRTPSPTPPTPTEQDKTKQDRNQDTSSNVPTLTPTDLNSTNLYRVFEGVTGQAPTFEERQDIDALVRKWDRPAIRDAMLADPHPKRNPDKLMGRVYFRLKEGAAA